MTTVDPSTVEQPPTREEVEIALSELYRPDGAAIWIEHPNKLLAGETPAALIERGDSQHVLDLIRALCEGVLF